MGKLSFNFLNRMERMICTGCPQTCPPASSFIAVSTLAAAVVSLIVIFVLQMFNVDKAAGEIVLGVCFGAAFLLSARRVWGIVAQTPSMGAKVGMTVYALVLFGVCALAFIYLMIWAIIITVGGLILWLILKVTMGDSGRSGKRIRAHYNDGSSEEMVEEVKGFCGETYYKGDSGRTHVE